MSTLFQPNEVSIIIPSLNSPIIDQVVAAIGGQSEAEQVANIVVVGKDEAKLLREGGPAQLIDTGQPVPPGAARNIGIQSTTTALLIFLDSDCLPQPGWLQAHLAAHAAGHAIVGGGVLPVGQNYWSLSYNLTMFHEYLSTSAPGPRHYLPTLNLSIERRIIDEVGLMDETLPRSQDIEWTTRMQQAGFQPQFWPAATIRHQHNRTTASKFWRDCVRSGQHASQVRLRYQETLATPNLLRSRLLVRLLSPLIAAWISLGIVRERPSMYLRHGFTLPAIYLSKIAWCWGAGRRPSSP